jgi:hypothetical protein
MNSIVPYRPSVLVILVLTGCIFLLTKCINEESRNTTTKSTPDRSDFAGSAACANCHKNIYAAHTHTAHFLTSRPATLAAIRGSFGLEDNSFQYDSGVVVTMERTDSGLYQVGEVKGNRTVARRFDMIIGSASKGQTYITRSSNNLFQLPVSWFTAARKWSNSPGFPIHAPLFDRAITARCLECHVTFAQTISARGKEPEEFDVDNIIYGVDCERCHGPGAKHAAFHTQHLAAKKAQFILDPASFTRQQSLDLCTLCHGGRMRSILSPFSFRAGDDLGTYFSVDTVSPPPVSIDVHGNQYGLLRASKCFRVSGTLTCVTCHNTHTNERGNIAAFSQRCAGCHNSAHGKVCGMTGSIGPAITSNCIDCHMPLQASRSITLLLPGNTTPTAALIRSHRIAIYPRSEAKIRDQ